MTKTLTYIKREAREKHDELLERLALDGMHSPEWDAFLPREKAEAELRAFLDTFADRLVEEVEGAVEASLNDPTDHGSTLFKMRVRGAFAKFKGEPCQYGDDCERGEHEHGV